MFSLFISFVIVFPMKMLQNYKNNAENDCIIVNYFVTLTLSKLLFARK